MVNLLSFFEVLALISGIVWSLAGIPQALKIFKRKSAKDISLTSRLLILSAGLIWLIYGILLENIPIVFSNIIGTVVESIVIWGFFKYR